jgi:hypothetical protein
MSWLLSAGSSMGRRPKVGTTTGASASSTATEAFASQSARFQGEKEQLAGPNQIGSVFAPPLGRSRAVTLQDCDGIENSHRVTGAGR